MAVIKLLSVRDQRHRHIIIQLGILLLVVLSSSSIPVNAAPLSDDPVQWYEDDRQPIPIPAEREPNLLWDMLDDSIFLPLQRFFHPGRAIRQVGRCFGGDHVPAAANVNSLDEVPNSTWFTNRIGLYRVTPASAARGPCLEGGPDLSGQWNVISAKTEGVTPGFVIKDQSERIWLIKFDPPGYLGMTTGAGVISNRILHSSGYNVPEDVVVQFDPSRLTLSEGVKLKLPDGTKRLMTDEDLAAIVEQVEKLDDGTIHAIASRYLSGRPIGPFNYVGRRRDDPNDRIDHRRRRELRGLRLFAAWINHFDVKQHNSLDMFVGDEQAGYVRHYLIDFASTLGAAANGPTPRYGYEFTVDLPAVAGRALALGLHDDAWRYLVLPDQLLEIGYFESERFDGLEFKSLQPNSAFADMTARDGYWAAKIISAFTDEHLRAIVEQAAYHSSDAAEYMSRTLAERRDKIARQLFDLVPPLDFFEIRESKIIFHDLGAERNIYPGLNQTYRTRVTLVDRSGDNLEWSEWDEQATTEVSLSPEVVVGSGTEGSVDIDQFPYLAIEAAVNRGSGWSDSVTAYFVRRDGRVVRIER